jgi:hypothetical protein
MVTHLQLAKLTSRIDALEQRFAPKPRNEVWLMEGPIAWRMGGSKEKDGIPVAEARARPCSGHRVEIRFVHPEPGGAGWLAACCLPGGECHALHGESGGNKPPGWTEARA